ncbi:MAG: hypothetical protein PHF67_01340 [Candidatus Nanoarchaeia archaeon]|nr:hypothetical protein [Candidatus Nanoarchaeia archaeon]
MSVYSLELGFRQRPRDLKKLLLYWGFVRNTDLEVRDLSLIMHEREMAARNGVDYRPTKVYSFGSGAIQAKRIFVMDPESSLLKIDPEISSELGLEIWNMRYLRKMFLMARTIRDRYPDTLLYDANYGRVVRD